MKSTSFKTPEMLPFFFTEMKVSRTGLRRSWKSCAPGEEHSLILLSGDCSWTDSIMWLTQNNAHKKHDCTKLKLLNQCLEYIFRTLVQMVLQDLQNTKWTKCIKQLQTHRAHDCECTEVQRLSFRWDYRSLTLPNSTVFSRGWIPRLWEIRKYWSPVQTTE